MEKIRIAVIGGSGVYAINDMKIIRKMKIKTPFGDTSDEITIGQIGDSEPMAFLPRHARGHVIMPSELPQRANIWALKSLGTEIVVSFSAVGSLKRKIQPEHLVLPTQIIDRTRGRVSSFFGDGIVGHIQFGDPFCNELIDQLEKIIKEQKYKYHRDETYICMEGPAFSTRAESNLYRSWGAGVIGMTALPEAKLAREAEMAYAIVAMSTDYDCWHEEEVSVDLVIKHINANVAKVQQIIRRLPEIKINPTNPVFSAAAGAIMTAPEKISAAAKKRLQLLYGKYWKK